MLVDTRVPVAESSEAFGHRRQSEIGGLAAGYLIPGERRRHAGVVSGSHGVGGGHRAVLGVLVVVDEHAVPLFLPPLAGRDGWRAPLDLARERQRGAAHLGE